MNGNEERKEISSQSGKNIKGTVSREKLWDKAMGEYRGQFYVPDMVFKFFWWPCKLLIF